jgi:hypothetical protein
MISMKWNLKKQTISIVGTSNGITLITVEAA